LQNELRQWQHHRYSAGRMKIDGATQVVGVFGSPITHTASPAMHNAAFAALKMNWVYLPFQVAVADLRAALQGVRTMNMVGVNLTVPHKIAAVELMDEVDPEACQLGAVNTVVVANNRLVGYNTDGYGFARAIFEEFNLTLKDKRVLVLGAGGAGRAISVKCVLDGAETVWVANRTPGKAAAIQQTAGKDGVVIPIPLTNDAVRQVIGKVDLLVNATSVGLRAADSLSLDPALFTSDLYVYDTIYQPAETELLKLAHAVGAKSANGLSMLLHQGVRAFEIWTKKMAPLAKMRQALKTAVYGDPK